MKLVKKMFILLIILAMFLNMTPVYALISAKALITGGLSFREEPSSDSKRISYIPYNANIDILSTTFYKGTGCSAGWYKGKYNDKIGYVCSKYISFYTIGTIAEEREAVTDLEKKFKEASFPSSYWDSLTKLQTEHPNYEFKAIKTGLDWATAVSEESILGTSLIQISKITDTNAPYISTMGGSYDYEKKEYNVLEGSSWYAADSEVVAYYMDPRNFLTDSRIFMFEDLAYTSDFITTKAIEKVFSGNFAYLSPYASAFVEAGKTAGVNPVYLAVLTRQELGGGSSVAVSGEKFCYPEVNGNYPEERGKCYESYYNFFNIGAGTDKKPVYNSLIYAKNKGWDTPLKAITGGANSIGKSYIKRGQNTSYFKRFNVKPGTEYTLYAHQYMTNIMAPYSESSTSYNTYNSIEALTLESEVKFAFEIPVYENMPTKTSLPTEVKFVTDYGKTIIDGLIADTLIKNDGTYFTGFTFGDTCEDLTKRLTIASSSMTVNIFDINGNAKTEGVIVTGDKVKLVYEEESQQYEIVLIGDVSGDAKIDLVDLLRVQKHIMNASNLTDGYLKAADTNQDGEVNIVDLLRIQKHILGNIKING